VGVFFKLDNVAAMHQVGQGVNSSNQVILQPQKVIVQPLTQPLRQLLKQSQHHQVISSSSAANVIATQIINQPLVGGMAQQGATKTVSVTVATSAGVGGTYLSHLANSLSIFDILSLSSLGYIYH